MNSGTKAWFDKLINNLDAYKTAHCQYPTVKHQQTGQIEFYDKENRRILRFSGSKSADSWTLNLVSFYPAKANELSRMKNNNANCQAKPNLTVRKVIAYNIGDKINAKFSNGTFPAFIVKKDPSFSNRYSNNSNTNTETTNKKVNFKVGDKIQVQTKTQGWLDGKIIKYASHKYLIKFDKNFRDSWISATQLRLKK